MIRKAHNPRAFFLKKKQIQSGGHSVAAEVN
jgi:hypothetical protein